MPSNIGGRTSIHNSRSNSNGNSTVNGGNEEPVSFFWFVISCFSDSNLLFLSV